VNYYVCFNYEMGAKKGFNNLVGAVIGTGPPFCTTKYDIAYYDKLFIQYKFNTLIRKYYNDHIMKFDKILSYKKLAF